jgi:hypothetical protein
VNNSLILRQVKSLYITLKAYLKNSTIIVLTVNKLNYIKELLNESSIIRFFIESWENGNWRRGLVYKNITGIVDKIYNTSGKEFFKKTNESLLLSILKYIFQNLLYFSSRVYGFFIIAFTISTAFKNTSGSLSKYLLLADMILIITGIILILINRSLKELYDGSKILKLVGGLFNSEE